MGRAVRLSGSAFLVLSAILVVNNATSVPPSSASGATPLAYVGNLADGTLSVIDTEHNVVEATPSGATGGFAAMTPDGQTLYLTIQGATVVQVFNATTDTPTGIDIPTNTAVLGLAVSPDGKRLYVAGNTGHNAGKVSVIDTATNTLTSSIQVGSRLGEVAVSPDGSTLYATSGSDDTVTVIDTATNAVTGTISVGLTPEGEAITPDGRTLYVANRNGGTVSAIDTATDSVEAVIPVGGSPTAVAITPDGRTAYVANFSPSDSVSVIDTASNNVTSTVPLASTLDRLASPPMALKCM